MRELDGRRMRTRVQGRDALTRSLRLLQLRVYRFASHRARTQADIAWSAQLLDSLTVALEVAGAERVGAGVSLSPANHRAREVERAQH